MIHLLYPDQSLSLKKFNRAESTFTDNNIYWNWTVEWLLMQCQIEYTRGTIPKNHCKNYLTINLYNPTSYEDFYNLPDEYINHLQNSNVNLLLYQATECNCYYWFEYQWSNFLKFLNDKQIPANKIYFITGDLKAQLNHKKFGHQYFSKINVIGLEIWEAVHLDRISKNAASRPNELSKLLESLFHYQNTPKSNNFMNLNAFIRPNKQAMLYYLHKNNYINDNIISCLWHDKKTIVDQDVFNQYNFDNSNYADFYKFISTFSKDIYDQHTFLSPLELYYQTKFSLINETHTLDNILFFTEKTYKPIAIGHPFLVFGTAGTLEMFRNKGYETFPELFDESYDTELDKSKRLEKIVNNLSNDIDITNVTIEKLRHNRSHFLQQSSITSNKEHLENFLC